MGLSATVAIGSRNLTNVYLHLREINLSIDTAAIRGVAFTSAYALIKAAVSGSTDLNANPDPTPE